MPGEDRGEFPARWRHIFRLTADDGKFCLGEGKSESPGGAKIKDAGRSSGVDDEILPAAGTSKLAFGNHQKTRGKPLPEPCRVESNGQSDAADFGGHRCQRRTQGPRANQKQDSQASEYAMQNAARSSDGIADGRGPAGYHKGLRVDSR